MKKQAQANKDYAKKLVAISLDASGVVSAERVEGVLAVLRENPPRHHRSLLKQYLTYLRRELAKGQAKVEFAGELTNAVLAEIKDGLSTRYNRGIDVVTQENPKLIAGFRVAIGDDVFDASVAGRLHALELATA